MISISLCRVPFLSSLGSQPGLGSASQPIVTVFHLEPFSFLLACISFAFECGGLTSFVSDQTIVVCSASVSTQ